MLIMPWEIFAKTTKDEDIEFFFSYLIEILEEIAL